MKSPKQWLRARLYNFVQHAVGDVVRPSDLLHFRSSLREIRTEFASANRDLQDLRLQVLDESGHNRLESVTLDLGKHLNSVHEEVLGLGKHLNSVHEEVLGLGKHLNSVHEELNTATRMLRELIERHETLEEKVMIQESRVRAKPFSTSSIELLSSRDGRPTLGYQEGNHGNYVDFIENFRPKFAELVQKLEYVTTWLPSAGSAVDLGAGRGEMVQVLRDYGLRAYGIDSDLSVVTEAKNRNLEVRHQDIESFLISERPSSLDVITAIQVVEHVDTSILENWFENIHKLLKPGGVFVAETPNPHAIDAFKAFWIDTSHVRLYYPESLLHMAQSVGFVSAEIWVQGTQDSIDERLGLAGSYTLIATA